MENTIGNTKYPNGSKFIYQSENFGIKSITFVAVLITSLLLSLFGLTILLAFPAIILVLFPRVYKKLRYNKISRSLLYFLSSKRTNLLDVIPGVYFKGDWFIEEVSEEPDFNSVRGVFYFIKSHWMDFFLIPVGFVVAFIRLGVWIGVLKIKPDLEDVIDLMFEGNMMFLIFILLPIFLSLYYIIVWTWEGAELKIAKINADSKKLNSNSNSIETQNKEDEYEIDELIFASNSIRNIVSIFAGYQAFVWVYERNLALDNPEFNLGYLIGSLLGVMIFTSGIGIFLGIMYLRSGVHENFVNEIREKIYDNYLNNQNEEYNSNKTNYIFVRKTSLPSLKVETTTRQT